MKKFPSLYTLVSGATNISTILQAIRKDKATNRDQISLSVLPVR